MRTGELRKRITIQSRSTERDSVGARVETWMDDATIWASVQPLRGSEYFSAQQVQSSVTHKVGFRYRKLGNEKALTSANCRIKLDPGSTERMLHVESVIDPSERHIKLELMCSEEV